MDNHDEDERARTRGEGVGYEIRLTDECWYDHILVEHAEMKRRVEEVKRAIQTPDYIYESKYTRSSHLYFREAGRGLSGQE